MLNTWTFGEIRFRPTCEHWIEGKTEGNAKYECKGERAGM
jgi:hypothetical protein